MRIATKVDYFFFFFNLINYTINLHQFYFQKWRFQNGEGGWEKVVNDNLSWDGDLSSSTSNIGHKPTLIVMA